MNNLLEELHEMQKYCRGKETCLDDCEYWEECQVISSDGYIYEKILPPLEGNVKIDYCDDYKSKGYVTKIRFEYDGMWQWEIFKDGESVFLNGHPDENKEMSMEDIHKEINGDIEELEGEVMNEVTYEEVLENAKVTEDEIEVDECYIAIFSNGEECNIVVTEITEDKTLGKVIVGTDMEDEEVRIPCIAVSNWLC